jgi:hypothetical protein
MATTYTLISSVTVGSGGAATMTFTSIPATYTDLLVVHSLRTSRSGFHENILLSFNGSTSNRSNIRLYGDITLNSTSDGLMFGGQASGATSTSNTFGNSSVYIPNYTSSNNKSSSENSASENNASTRAVIMMNALLWSNSAAITSITLTPENGGTIQQYSTGYLYGISNA